MQVFIIVSIKKYIKFKMKRTKITVKYILVIIKYNKNLCSCFVLLLTVENFMEQKMIGF